MKDRAPANGRRLRPDEGTMTSQAAALAGAFVHDTNV